jgi:hypothetical protein
MVVLVAADRFAGDPVDVGQAVDPAANQHRMDRGRLHSQATADLDWAQTVPPPQPHDLAHDLRISLVRDAVRA